MVSLGADADPACLGSTRSIIRGWVHRCFPISLPLIALLSTLAGECGHVPHDLVASASASPLPPPRRLGVGSLERASIGDGVLRGTPSRVVHVRATAVVQSRVESG